MFSQFVVRADQSIGTIGNDWDVSQIEAAIALDVAEYGNSPDYRPEIAVSVPSLSTYCYGWRITRIDGTVLGFTNHDRDFTNGGVTYKAKTGFTAKGMRKKADFSIDNTEMSAFLDSDSITEIDLLRGQYDGALLEIFIWDWLAGTRVATLLAKGLLGNAKMDYGIATAQTFTIEGRSRMQRLNQKSTLVTTSKCRHALGSVGDGLCNKVLTSFTVNTTISQIHNPKAFSVSASLTQGAYRFGYVEFTSGLCEGMRFYIKGNSIHVVELYLPVPMAIAIGDTATLVQGCEKSFQTCIDKFNNGENHGAFPHLPGVDLILRGGSQ
jgi:uncharacterized phage protein (TIGR02218 family)